jgi:hypothetical protein
MNAKMMKGAKIPPNKIRGMAVEANTPEVAALDLFKGKRRINLCGHEIYALVDGPEDRKIPLHFPPYRKEPRVVQEKVYDDEDPTLYTLKYVDITNMPKKMRGIEYIVSLKVLEAAQELYPDRKDLLAPGEQIRDPKTNKVVCCRNFIKRSKAV